MKVNNKEIIEESQVENLLNLEIESREVKQHKETDIIENSINDLSMKPELVLLKH